MINEKGQANAQCPTKMKRKSFHIKFKLQDGIRISDLA